MKWLMDFLVKIFSPKRIEIPAVVVTVGKAPIGNIGKNTIQERVYALAKLELGVKEFKSGSNKVIEKYHAYATEKNLSGADDAVPWCASFVCYCLEMAGLKSTNSKSARSYEAYGMLTKAPVFGDIVVFWRETKTSGKGHVAFFSGYDSSGNIKTLGGNQSDEVNIASYSKDRLICFRTY